MIVRKDRQYLIFDFEDGQTVQYDLEKKITIGKLGKPVKNLRSQLRGYTVSELLECFENKQYGYFLEFVQQAEGGSISNIGTILERAKHYAKMEQFFSAGLRNIQKNLRYNIGEIPTGLLKLCKEYDFRLTNEFIAVYKDNPNMVNLIFSLEYTTIEPKNLYEILLYGNYSALNNPSFVFRLVNDYGYSVKALFLYLDHLFTYEALGTTDTVRELYDYAVMMKKISDKFEKYPRNFLTTHQIAARNYNRLKQEFIEKDFVQRRDESLEFSYKGLGFIYPKTTQEIKDEAVQQGNCVASYIQKVIDGKCHILFLRRTSTPNESLVTIEVRDGKVVQAKGKYNRDVTSEEQAVINIYNKRLERTNAA